MSREAATAYTVNLDASHDEWITVELTCLAGEGPHKPRADTWAVRRRGWCLNSEGDWDYEPMPSSRDDEFFAAHRWGLPEALERARAAADRSQTSAPDTPGREDTA